MKLMSGNVLSNPLTILSQFFQSLFAFFVELLSFNKRFERNTAKKEEEQE